MSTYQAEMNFDARREDKGVHTGGIPLSMSRMLRVLQATKQGAKGIRPLSGEDKDHGSSSHLYPEGEGYNVDETETCTSPEHDDPGPVLPLSINLPWPNN